MSKGVHERSVAKIKVDGAEHVEHQKILKVGIFIRDVKREMIDGNENM